LLSDEGVDNRTLVAHDTLNCNLRGGMLCTGLGLKIHYVGNSTSPVVLRDTLQRIYTFDRATMVTHAREFEGMCFYTSKGNLGLVELDGTYYVLSDTFTGVPHMATVVGQSNQVYTVFTSKGFFYHGEIGAWRKYTLENGLTPVCACKDRLFIAYNTRSIRYSDVYDQRLEDRTLEGGGSIHLPYGFGEIKAMVALDNKVYVFEQYGAVCIDVQGSPKDFVVTPLDYHGGEIYGDSVGVHQGMIWFLAEDGVHRFNGNRFESVAEFLKIRPSVTNKECGFGFCGEYYILQYQDLRQGVRRSVAIHEDGKSERRYFRG
jgi:hypothetical protein